MYILYVIDDIIKISNTIYMYIYVYEYMRKAPISGE